MVRTGGGAAEVGFVRQAQYADEAHQVVAALLWEADPIKFAARYPDSGIVETYGEDAWSGVHCIDYWGFDGSAIADTFARILGVPSPRV